MNLLLSLGGAGGFRKPVDARGPEQILLALHHPLDVAFERFVRVYGMLPHKLLVRVRSQAPLFAILGLFAVTEQHF